MWGKRYFRGEKSRIERPFKQGVSETMEHMPRLADPAFLSGLDPKYLWMMDYLDSLSPRGLASKQDVDPTCFPELIPFVNLVDVLNENEDGLRFRFRLVGGEQNRRAGRFIAGKYVEDAVLPDYADRILLNMRTCVESRAPVYDRFPMPHPDRSFVDSERVYYPLGKDGHAVDTLLILNGYADVVCSAGTFAIRAM